MSSDTKRMSPLHAWHSAHGAKMVEFAGWDMPVQYGTGIVKEHLATRKFGGLFDVSHMGRFRIGGKHAIRFLQHVLSNNVETLEPLMAEYTLIPDEEGGVLDDCYLYRLQDKTFLLVVNAGNAEKDWAYLRQHAGSFDDASLEDDTDKTSMIAFQGPLTGEVLERVLEAGSLPLPQRNYMSEATISGTEVLVSRTGYTGEPIGFEIFVSSEKAELVWTRLYEAGRDDGIVPVGLGARDTLRLEAGMPLYGHELGLDPDGVPIPAFASTLAGAAISFSGLKGDYIGRKRLAEQFEQIGKLYAGLYEPSDVLRRCIRPLALLDRGVARQGHEVFIDDRKVGVVTSGTMIPFWVFEGEGATMTITDEHGSRAIALAFLDAEVEFEQEVEVAVRNRRLKAEVVRWHGRSEAPPYYRSLPVGYIKEEREPASGEGAEKAMLLTQKAMENHEWRQQRCINLIPSEMTQSPLVRLLQVSDPVGRYAEHKGLIAAFEQEVFYYQGTDFIAWVEDRLAAEMAAFLDCPLVETRLISGLTANATVFSALVDWRNRANRRREPERIRLVMNNRLGAGGHLSAQTLGTLRDFVAKDPVTERFAVVNFPVCEDNPYRMDVEETLKLVNDLEPELIIFGKSMVLHPEPVAEIKQAFGNFEVPPIIMYDMAHVLGLVGPHFQQPFQEGADIVTGSTHKTFFGTQRGIIGSVFEENTPRFELWEAINRRAFPGMVSNHHLGTLLGLLMAAIEMNTFKDEYQPQVTANAKAFARALKHEGVAVEGDAAVDFTETHQVVVNVGHAKACQVAQDLEANNIIVNYQVLPADEGSTASSGLRMGVSEMTRFGMKETDFETFAGLFADAVLKDRNVSSEVARFRENFRTMHYCFSGGPFDTLKKQVLETF